MFGVQELMSFPVHGLTHEPNQDNLKLESRLPPRRQTPNTKPTALIGAARSLLGHSLSVRKF